MLVDAHLDEYIGNPHARLSDRMACEEVEASIRFQGMALGRDCEISSDSVE